MKGNKMDLQKDELLKMAKYYELKNISSLSDEDLTNKINNFLEDAFDSNWM